MLPSAVRLLVARAKANTALAAIQGTRVGSKLNATLPATRVQRVGGSVPDTWEDNPVVQIEAWAADEETADLLARTWLDALPAMRHRAADGQVHSYSVQSVLFAPDDQNLSSNSRFIITARLLVTP